MKRGADRNPAGLEPLDLNDQEAKAQALKPQINRTDKEIDRMVYALFSWIELWYGLIND